MLDCRQSFLISADDRGKTIGDILALRPDLAHIVVLAFFDAALDLGGIIQLYRRRMQLSPAVINILRQFRLIKGSLDICFLLHFAMTVGGLLQGFCNLHRKALSGVLRDVLFQADFHRPVIIYLKLQAALEVIEQPHLTKSVRISGGIHLQIDSARHLGIAARHTVGLVLAGFKHNGISVFVVYPADF